MVQGVVMMMAQDVVMMMAQDVVMMMALDVVTTKTMVHGAEVQMMDPEGMTAPDAGTTKVQGEGTRMEEDLITGGKVHEAAAVIATGTEEEAHHLGGSRTIVKNAVEEEVAGVIVVQVVDVKTGLPGETTDVEVRVVAAVEGLGG